MAKVKKYIRKFPISMNEWRKKYITLNLEGSLNIVEVKKLKAILDVYNKHLLYTKVLKHHDKYILVAVDTPDQIKYILNLTLDLETSLNLKYGNLINFYTDQFKVGNRYTIRLK